MTPLELAGYTLVWAAITLVIVGAVLFGVFLVGEIVRVGRMRWRGRRRD